MPNRQSRLSDIGGAVVHNDPLRGTLRLRNHTV